MLIRGGGWLDRLGALLWLCAVLPVVIRSPFGTLRRILPIALCAILIGRTSFLTFLPGTIVSPIGTASGFFRGLVFHLRPFLAFFSGLPFFVTLAIAATSTTAATFTATAATSGIIAFICLIGAFFGFIPLDDILWHLLEGGGLILYILGADRIRRMPIGPLLPGCLFRPLITIIAPPIITVASILSGCGLAGFWFTRCRIGRWGAFLATTIALSITITPILASILSRLALFRCGFGPAFRLHLTGIRAWLARLRSVLPLTFAVIRACVPIRSFAVVALFLGNVPTLDRPLFVDLSFFFFTTTVVAAFFPIGFFLSVWGVFLLVFLVVLLIILIVEEILELVECGADV